MIPVERRNSQNPCLTTDAVCDDTDKWFDLITQPFSVPLVAASIDISVCDPTRYAVGQWVYIMGAGIFWVTVINENGTLTVRNSCSDGVSPIAGNSAPGVLIPIGAELWIIAEPGWPQCVGDANCANMLACLAAATDICIPNIPDAADTDPIGLIGTEAAGKCLRNIPGILSQDNALRYSNRSALGGAKTISGGTPTAKKFVINDPSTGADQPLTVGNNDTGFWKYVDGDLVFVNGGTLFIPEFAEIFNQSGISLIAGSTTHVTSALPNYPAGASHALIHVQAYATTTVSADLFVYKIKIGGREVLIYAGSEQWNVDDAPIPAHNDNIIPIPISDGSALTMDNEVVDPTSAGVLTLKAWIHGYYV